MTLFSIHVLGSVQTDDPEEAERLAHELSCTATQLGIEVIEWGAEDEGEAP